MPYINFNLDWPPSVRGVWRVAWCTARGHDFELVGDRELRTGHLEALLLWPSKTHVERCRVCGHYRERFAPRYPFGPGHSMIMKIPRMDGVVGGDNAGGDVDR